jgi:DNA-binding SARP family transcriptional activator/predicted ATPase
MATYQAAVCPSYLYRIWQPWRCKGVLANRMPPQLELLLLGKPLIRRDSLPVAAALPAKGQALLFYLAVTGQAHSRSRLAGLFWGDMPDEVARANLRLTLSRLRKELGGALAASRQEVALRAGYRLDVAEFEQLATLPSSPDLTLPTAVALYRADFLTDFELDESLEFESWMLAERARLRQLAQDLFYRLAQTGAEAGDLAHGIEAARHLLRLEPWHEEGHRQLMWLLAAAGQRSAALAQYEICSRLLQEELGVQPADETTALYQAIRQDQVPRPELAPGPAAVVPTAVAPAAPPRHNLPPQLTPFVGREAEVARLLQRLGQPSYRLVTLVGEGGVGKTRLALVVARQMLPDFADGVWLVSLAGLAAPAALNKAGRERLENQIAGTIAAAVGLTFSGAQEPKAQLITYLRSLRCLLVLDNFEGLIAAAGLVVDLLAATTAVSVLVTSREPLHYQAEYVLRLKGLAVPETDLAAPLADYDSLKLLAERVERASGRLSLTPESLPDAVAICRFVNGLPLAIELAASWSRWLPLADILAALRADAAELQSTARDIPPRHRNLRALFHYSWRFLAEAEQATLAQLSVFRRAFDLEAAIQVTGATPARLWSLVDKSLVQRGDNGYFYLHELLRRFAAEQLTGLDLDQPALCTRHATYYLNFMSERAAALNGPAPRAAIEAVHFNYDNVSQAWHWAIQQAQTAELTSGLTGMVNYWTGVGLYREAERSLAEALTRLQAFADETAVANPALVKLLASLQVERAQVLVELGELDEAARAAAAGISLAEATGDPALLAAGHLRRGTTLFYHAEYRATRQAYLQALSLVENLATPALAGAILRGLAAVAWRLGDLDQAQQYARRAGAQFQQAGDARGEARTNYLMAILAHFRQDHQRAQSLLERTLVQARTVQDRRLEMGVYATLGQIANYQGEFEKALAYFEQERRLCREMAITYQLCVNLSNLGDTRLNMGDYAAARADYEEALATAAPLKAPDIVSNLLAYRGLLAYQTGAYAAGENDCRQALALAQAAAAQREQAFAWLFLGHNLLAQQRLEEARAAYEAAGQAWQVIGDKMRSLAAGAGLTQVALAQKDTAAALEHVSPLLAHLQNGALDGADDPVWLYLTAYQALRAVAGPPASGDAPASDNGDPSAADALLESAQNLLLARAAQIKDSARRRAYLENIPSHRALRTLIAA